MEVKEQIKLKFTGVAFPTVNVRLFKPLVPDSNPSLDVLIVPKVFYPESAPLQFTIIFDLKLTAKDHFNIEVIAFGFFLFDEEVSDEKVKKAFININAPAIMFPYVRSFVSTLTANLGAGLAPIILPPQFFQGELVEQKNSPKKEKVDGDSSPDMISTK